MDDALEELTRRDVLKGAVTVGVATMFSGTAAAQEIKTDSNQAFQPGAFLLGAIDKSPNDIEQLQDGSEFFDNKVYYGYIYQQPNGTQWYKTQDMAEWSQITMNPNKDALGKQKSNGIFGQAHAESRLIEVQTNFRYNIASDDFFILSADGTDGVSGSGNVGVTSASGDGGIGFVETGTGTSGSAIVQDRNRARYRPGTEMGAQFTARFDTASAATLRIGLHDFDDGFYLEHNGSEYRFVNLQDGTERVSSRSDWYDPLDGSGPSEVTIDFSTLSIFRITFGYLGTAPAWLEHYTGPEKGWVKVDVFDFTGLTGTNVRNPSLPVQMEATRESGSTNASVGSGSWMGFVLANSEVDADLRSFDAEGDRDTVSTDTNEHILTVQVKETYQGLPNDIQIQPAFMNVIGDADDNITFYLVRGATTTDTLTFSDRNTENSVVEIATDATDVTGQDRIIARRKIPPSSNRGSEQQGSSAEIKAQRLSPGERMSVYATTPGAPNGYEAVVGWRELF